MTAIGRGRLPGMILIFLLAVAIILLELSSIALLPGRSFRTISSVFLSRSENHEINGSLTCCFESSSSKYSQRKFIASVIVMANEIETNARLAEFSRKWNNAWPGLKFKVTLSHLNNPSIRGYAVLSAHYRVMVEAIVFKEYWDYLLVFEDDAFPFNSTTWPSEEVQNDLDFMLDKFEEAKGSGLLLGGHHVQHYNIDELRDRSLPRGIIRAELAYGAYAMLIPRNYIRQTAKVFGESLGKKNDTRYASDSENWVAWNRLGAGGFVAVPLMVDHQNNYSFTWGRHVPRPFTGRRDFWNLESSQQSVKHN